VEDFFHLLLASILIETFAESGGHKPCDSLEAVNPLMARKVFLDDISDDEGKY
jgi:hypothetical protein